MIVRQAFEAYGRSVAVMCACAVSLLIAQELHSPKAALAASLVAAFVSLALWRRLRFTANRFLIAVGAVVAIAFFAVGVNEAAPGTAWANVAALLFVIGLAASAIYAFREPPPNLAQRGH